MKTGLLAFTATLLLASGANGARECGSLNTSSTYPWRLGAARYDGAEPGDDNGSATVAFSIVPGNSTMGTFFECVAEWPESWEGWYEDGNIIWSDCIWAGNGRTYDTAISFATDWKNRTLYISHTFACSDRQGSDSLATGSVYLDMDCATATDNSSSCTLKGDGLDILTKGGPARLEADSCTDNSQRYQSWQLENWQRQYEAVPGSSAAPKSDTGPSFILRNMANTDVFNCSASGNSNNTFDGACTPAEEENSTTTATFRFDSQRDLLIVDQQWNCSDSTSLFDATGVGYVQATCSRQGDLLTCTSDPLWIGTKTI